jgi:hypothetical protein
MTKRKSERGSAMLITLILMAAILAGAAVLVSMQLGANRATEVTRTGISALYCAEAGLTATRTTIAANRDNWDDYLGLGTEPSWLAPIEHDLDGDGNADFIVTLEDDTDELPPTPEDPLLDTNGRVFVVSRCIKYVDFPREVRDLVGYQQQSNCYNSQRGGCAGNGNMNQ